MLTLPGSVRVFVAQGATDLRRSFDRLSAQVQEVLRQDPLPCVCVLEPPTQSGEVAGVGAGRVLAAVQAAGGGSFAALDRDEINARELYLLLEGIEVIRERRRYTR